MPPQNVGPAEAAGVSELPLVGSTKVELVRAHLGTVSLSGIGGSPVKMGLKRAVLHPQYNAGILDFDAAVLELARPLVFGKYVQPICLPLATQKFPAGRKCMISGWGSTQEGNGESSAGPLLPRRPLAPQSSGLPTPAHGPTQLRSMKFYRHTAVLLRLQMALTAFLPTRPKILTLWPFLEKVWRPSCCTLQSLQELMLPLRPQSGLSADHPRR